MEDSRELVVFDVESIVGFYFRPGANGLPHYAFMDPARMKHLFTEWLPRLKNKALKIKVQNFLQNGF